MADSPLETKWWSDFFLSLSAFCRSQHQGQGGSLDRAPSPGSLLLETAGMAKSAVPGFPMALLAGWTAGSPCGKRMMETKRAKTTGQSAVCLNRLLVFCHHQHPSETKEIYLCLSDSHSCARLEANKCVNDLP